MYYAKLAALAEKALFHGAIGTVFVAWLLVAPAVQAQLPDAADVAEGMRLFLQKGNCQACHGWAGDGRKMDSQMPDGAQLREVELLADFLFAKVIGKGPMNRAKCREYWGAEVEACGEFPN